MQTSTNAKSVPMFVSSTKTSRLAKAERAATAIPIQMVVTCGVLYFGWTFAKEGESSPSRAMEKKMRGWPYWKTSSTAVVAITAPKATMPAAQFIPSSEKASSERLRRPADLVERNHPGEHERGRDVEDRADGQRPDHADRHVLLRVAALLGGGRDGVEADVGEEDEGRAGPDPGPAVGREGVPVGGLDVEGADDDEEDEDDELDGHHHGVEPRRTP